MSQRDFVIYVDFDSTIYNTSEFSANLCQFIAGQAQLSVSQVREDGASHFFHPTLGGYEYEKHIAIYNLNSKQMWDQLAAIAQQTNYLFPGTVEFLRGLQADGYRPAILTFGEERFQLAKIQPVIKYLTENEGLDAIDVIVVDQRKAQHISALHDGQRGVLIDDKPDQQLPAGFTEIHLAHDKNIEHPEIRNNIAVVSTLAQARKIIDQLNEQ